MRLMWISNSMTTCTGYGMQTRMAVPRIKNAGHDIAISAFWGQEGSPSINSQGIMTYPRLADSYMNDVIAMHYAHHRAEAIISLIDVFVLDPRKYAQMFWVAWCPIDSEPMFPSIPTHLKSAKRVWAMSHFGERQLIAAGFTNVDYVPHGIDHKEFFPQSDKAEVLARLKRDIGIDLANKYVITMNSANKGVPSRKGFNEAFASFRMFSETHPDAVLYVHSEMLGIHQGEPLENIREMYGIDKSKVIYAPQYHYVNGMLPPSYLNDIYAVSDVFLHTSHGEGFGIPIVEAQTAGLPVIVTDCSSMPELCFSGWLVPGVPYAPAPGMLHRIPIIPKVVEALEAAYQQRGSEQLRKSAIAGAADYDADLVFERHMLPALAKIEVGVKAEQAKQAELARLTAIAEKALDGKAHVAGTIAPKQQAFGKGKKGKKKVRA